MRDPSSFWFPAKRYGFGWALPTRWQGWAVLAVYCVLVLAGVRFLQVERGTPAFLAYLVAITVMLVAIVAAKGERPLRWRWGKR
jgi:hypothetical protein